MAAPSSLSAQTAPSPTKWVHACLRTVTLPSSFPNLDKAVTVEVTDNVDLIYGDPDLGVEPQVPDELTPIAERVEFEGFDPEKESLLVKYTKEERIQLARYRVWLIADRLRDPKMPRDSEGKLTAAALKQAKGFPYEDQQAIFRIITHGDLKERVVLASFRDIKGGTASNGNGKAEGASSE